MINHRYKLKNLSKEPLPITLLIPNMITLFGLCCGISSLKFALNANWNFALIGIFFACLFDVLDGALARMLKATSVFGAQLDSLSDFMCFGVTPAFIIYIWNSSHYDMFGWISVIFFILCMVIRLARFNSDVIKDDKRQQQQGQKKQDVNGGSGNGGINEKKSNFFKGVPAPASAMLALLPIILTNSNGFNINWSLDFLKIWMPIYTIFISFLTVSKIPTFSIKNLKINKKYFSFIILFIGSLIILLITYPWKIIPIILFFYFLSIIFSIMKFNKEKQLSKKNNLLSK